MQQSLPLAVLLLIVLPAAWCDLRARRIPNAITLPGLLAGLALAAVSGWSGLGTALATAGGMLALGVVLFGTGILGGGDVKLLVACAALLGPERSAWALALTAFFGAALALWQAARAGVILPVLLNCRDLMISRALPGRRAGAAAVAGADGVAAVSVPYGVAIALGAMAAWLA